MTEIGKEKTRTKRKAKMIFIGKLMKENDKGILTLKKITINGIFLTIDDG